MCLLYNIIYTPSTMKKNKKRVIIQKQEDLPAEKLFQMAEQKNQQMDFQQAGHYYNLAYKKDSQNDLIVLCYADFLKNNDETKKAIEILTTSIKLKPQGTYKRYFQLAELYHGVQSIEIFQKGIKAAMGFNLKQYNLFETHKISQKQVRRDVANAYAAIAQVCMTDLIDVKQAESKCIQALKNGMQIDSTSMDIFLQTSNYLLFKDDVDGAKEKLLVIYNNAIKKQQQAQYEQYTNQLKQQTARYLIEVQCFMQAAQLLRAVNQTGKDLELQYLLAYCYFKNKNYATSLQQLEQYESLAMENQVDPQIADAALELKSELDKIDKKLFQEPEEIGEGEVNEDDWMDIEDA